MPSCKCKVAAQIYKLVSGGFVASLRSYEWVLVKEGKINIKNELN